MPSSGERATSEQGSGIANPLFLSMNRHDLELSSSFLQRSVQSHNGSFTIDPHPDVGEGAGPQPVRPGRAFYLRDFRAPGHSHPAIRIHIFTSTPRASLLIERSCPERQLARVMHV